MNEATSTPSPLKSPGRWGAKLAIGIVVLLLAGVLLWRWPASRQALGLHAPESTPVATSIEQRLQLAEQTLAQLEQQRQQWQLRLNESSQRTNLLRDEVLGIGERSALLEDSVREMSQGSRNAQADLRVSEAELLLIMARERWQLTGDLAGTIQATELAAVAVNGLNDSRWLNLRQALAQELAAWRAVESEPRAIARSELDALEVLIPQLPPAHAGNSPPAGEYGLKRLMNALIRVEPSDKQSLISPSERQAAQTALALELANARFALQLRQSHEYKRSVLRIHYWLGRLYANTPALSERRTRLLASADAPLVLPMPLAGSSLLELQRLKNSGAP